MTAFGYQSNGSAPPTAARSSGNRIWFNSSYDEGGAVMVAGELPTDPTRLSDGTGPVTIDKNVISENLANDDGGGIRVLQASGSHVSRLTPGTVTISNNTVTEQRLHPRGRRDRPGRRGLHRHRRQHRSKQPDHGLGRDQRRAPGAGRPLHRPEQRPAAGAAAQHRLFPGSATLASTTFSKPTVLDDVFSDNRAGSFSGGWVTGIGGTLPDGTPNDVNNWDMGLADGSGTLSPVGSVIQSTEGTDGGTSTTVTDDPGFKDPSTVSVDVLASRTYPAFRQSLIIGELLPPTLSSDYHLSGQHRGGVRQGRGRHDGPPRLRDRVHPVELPVSAAAQDMTETPVPAPAQRAATTPGPTR